MTRKKHFKYAHLIWGDELKFSTRLVELLCDPANELRGEDTLFVTPYSQVYDALKDKGNIELVEYENKRDGRIVNYCGERADWIFIHNICSPLEGLKIKKKYLGRIIWRTWGSDGKLYGDSGNAVKRIIKRAVGAMWRRRVRSFYDIGIADTVDRLNMVERYGEVRTMHVAYAGRGNFDSLIDARNIKKDGDCLNVMIGHSGFSNDNHIGVMTSLERFSDRNMRIYMVLSYGEEDYIKKVREYVDEKWSGKVVIIDKFMPYGEFASLLGQMDVAIFDGRASYALGNIGMLLFLEKKIFLNPDGVIRRAFDLEDVPYALTDSIEKMTFDEFSAPIEYKNANNNLAVKSYEENIADWKAILAELDLAEK